MLRVWGCMGLVMVPKEQRHKLEVAAMWVVHLGMASDSNGWLMWDPKSKKTLLSHDIMFVEDVMYKDWQQQHQVQIGLRLQEIQRSAVEEVQLHLEDLAGSELTSDHSGGGEQQGAGPAAEEGFEDESARVDSPSQPKPTASAKVTKRSVQKGASPHGQQTATRKKRVAEPPSRPKYSRLGGPKQGAMAVQADEGDDEEMVFCYFTPLPGEPATLEETLSGPQKEEWKAAMDAELGSLTLLASAAAKGWYVKQMDITIVFLNGVLLEDIYMAQPDGYEDGTSRVCKFKKAIYGIKQAPRCWYEKQEEVLLGGGFKTSQADHSLERGSNCYCCWCMLSTGVVMGPVLAWAEPTSWSDVREVQTPCSSGRASR
ncbi:unnamed protein product [Closterium sp. NIES-54]